MSNSPAHEAVFESSAVALLRTATNFALSVLKYGNASEKEEIIDEDSIIEEEEYVEDLTDVLPEEKLYDDEYIDYDNLEQ